MTLSLVDRAEADVSSALARLGYSFTTTRPSTTKSPRRIWALTFGGTDGEALIPVILFVNRGCFGGAVVVQKSEAANLDATNRMLFKELPSVRLVPNRAHAGFCSLRLDFPLADEGPVVARSAVAFACTILQMSARMVAASEGFSVSSQPSEEVHAFDVDIDGLVAAASAGSDLT